MTGRCEPLQTSASNATEICGALCPAAEMGCLAALIPADFSVGILSIWNIKARALSNCVYDMARSFYPAGVPRRTLSIQ